MNSTRTKTAYAASPHRSGSSLFLLELIIAVGFFAVAGVVCINMFLHAHRISEAAAQKTEAVRITQNCAESFIAADGDRQEFAVLLEKAFPEAELSFGNNDRLVLLLPDEGLQADLITEHEKGDTDMLRITVGNTAGAEIFRLDVRDYPQKEGQP